MATWGVALSPGASGLMEFSLFRRRERTREREGTKFDERRLPPPSAAAGLAFESCDRAVELRLLRFSGPHFLL